MSSSDDEILPDAEKRETPKSVMKKKSHKSTKQKDSDCAISDSSDSTSNSDSSDSEYFCNICNKRFSGFAPYKQHGKSGKHAKAVLKQKRAKKILAKIAAGENNSDSDDERLLFIPKPFAVCKVCDKQFGGPESYEMHLASKTHKQKVIQVSIIKKVKNKDEINEDLLKELYKNKLKSEDENADDLEENAKEKISSLKEDGASGGHETFDCKVCEKSFSGIIPYTQHVLSKVHAKAIEKKNLLGKVISEDVQNSSESSKRDISSLAEEDGILVCNMCKTSFSGPENALMHLKSRGHSKNLEKLTRRLQRKKNTPEDNLHESNPSTEVSQTKTLSKQIPTQPKELEAFDAKTKIENNSESSSSSEDSSDDLGQQKASKSCSSANEQSKNLAKQSENKQKRVTESDEDAKNSDDSGSSSDSSDSSKDLSKKNVIKLKPDGPATSSLKYENSKKQNEAASGVDRLPSSEKYNSYKKAMQSLKESNI